MTLVAEAQDRRVMSRPGTSADQLYTLYPDTSMRPALPGDPMASQQGNHPAGDNNATAGLSHRRPGTLAAA